ncbi:hypothetical protein SNOG_00601 [Parastagonospora nodorum SN15]|uniref:Uncharacterized protein n=1 Tax=Phaeosphaeria nodorum (strain SN15 / ATCC MYA-4574 / FGSC 10173) TaxID=321614 RepID=Q0V5W3_PHANO|nr:hypothetical protein SNOG_00601 [Parastagonospora nodorum SN15]EAT92096.1 hypothetical protein SNOG_00601 [Parastagonospora nodorum SN15]
MGYRRLRHETSVPPGRPSPTSCTGPPIPAGTTLASPRRSAVHIETSFTAFPTPPQRSSRADWVAACRRERPITSLRPSPLPCTLTAHSTPPPARQRTVFLARLQPS